jgi:hypothetical protein
MIIIIIQNITIKEKATKIIIITIIIIIKINITIKISIIITKKILIKKMTISKIGINMKKIKIIKSIIFTMDKITKLISKIDKMIIGIKISKETSKIRIRILITSNQIISKLHFNPTKIK